ncbi:cell envelope biogenesis protein OmpA [uncultured Dokdonia sp.]|uniref:cell envelope biogenesis protein OmpA n=1 Tax=uncultured Dokdonia sp. TaxID=575653 RepID=UPI002615655C|nr:cell envelope biogenesis protein OmpA [uncultured Dokdonia sp.]
MNSKERLEILKEILLTEEREFDRDLVLKIEQLRSEQENLSDRVTPILDERMDDFVQKMPKALGPVITETLKTEIKKSQEAVAEALYPIMGKMIKKYVQAEIKKLNEDINQRLNKTFSFRNWFSGKDNDIDAAALMYEQYEARIEQIMVIEKGSGLLKANYAKRETLDEDMLAGMLTAIKSFVEDAYNQGEMELERIDYELFTIHLQNFSNYYIAVVITGIYDDNYKDKLEDVLLDFAQFVVNKSDLENPETFTKKLKSYFTDERI